MSKQYYCVIIEKKNEDDISIERKFVCKAKNKEKAEKKALNFFDQDNISIIEVKDLLYFYIPNEQVIIKL